MKTPPAPRSFRLIPLGALLLVTACATAAPQVTPDGLTEVRNTRADALYVRSGVSFAGYTKVVIIEPTIAFRKDWQADKKMEQPLRPVTDADMAKMIAMGKKLLVEQFARALTKAGYTLANETGADVLAIKLAIQDLDVAAPDPNNDAGSSFNKTYSAASEATLAIELYDSVTGQLLARAYDRRSGETRSSSSATERTQQTNITDASYAMGQWARLLVKGLEDAKAAKVP